MPDRAFPTLGTLALTTLLAIHAIIHGLGVAKAFGLLEIPRLRPIARPLGFAWLAALLLLGLGAALILASSPRWWLAVAAGVVTSQAVVFTAWTDAKFASLPNAVLVIPTLLAALEAAPSSLSSRFHTEAEAGLRALPQPALITEADLARLPDPVRAYLRVTGAVGRPRVENYRATFRGQIRSKPDGPWMDFEAVQQSFEQPQARLFLLKSSLFGLPFVAFHRYVGNAATMEVRAAGLFTVADAKGREMNQSETVTLLNDKCILAPATLVDETIRWESLGPLSVRASFSNAGNTISAVLLFDEQGRLVNFYSDDRYQTADGKTYVLYRWSTPLDDYRDFGGVRLAGYGEASWRMPDGELVYGRFHLTSVQYNVKGRALAEGRE
jgi:hypothetical protein